MVYHDGWYKYSFPTHTFYMVVCLQCTPIFFAWQHSIGSFQKSHPCCPCCTNILKYLLLQSYNPIFAMQYRNVWNSPSYTHVAQISCTALCAQISHTFAQPFWYSKETNNGTYITCQERHVICWEKDGTCIGLSIYLNVFNIDRFYFTSISESILWPQSPRWFAWCEVWARSWKIANWCCFPGRVTASFLQICCSLFCLSVSSC